MSQPCQQSEIQMPILTGSWAVVHHLGRQTNLNLCRKNEIPIDVVLSPTSPQVGKTAQRTTIVIIDDGSIASWLQSNKMACGIYTRGQTTFLVVPPQLAYVHLFRTVATTNTNANQWWHQMNFLGQIRFHMSLDALDSTKNDPFLLSQFPTSGTECEFNSSHCAALVRSWISAALNEKQFDCESLKLLTENNDNGKNFISKCEIVRNEICQLIVMEIFKSSTECTESDFHRILMECSMRFVVENCAKSIYRNWIIENFPMIALPIFAFMRPLVKIANDYAKIVNEILCIPAKTIRITSTRLNKSFSYHFGNCQIVYSTYSPSSGPSFNIIQFYKEWVVEVQYSKATGLWNKCPESSLRGGCSSAQNYYGKYYCDGTHDIQTLSCIHGSHSEHCSSNCAVRNTVDSVIVPYNLHHLLAFKNIQIDEIDEDVLHVGNRKVMGFKIVDKLRNMAYGNKKLAHEPCTVLAL